MSDSNATTEAVKAVSKVMGLPPDQRRDYLEMLGHAATKYMRAIGGDEYVRGWLQAALSELDGPPMIQIQKAH